MCKKLLDSIKTLFSKDKKDKATLEVNVSNQSQDKINSKSKRIKNGDDNSVNIIGDEANHERYGQYFGHYHVKV